MKANINLRLNLKWIATAMLGSALLMGCGKSGGSSDGGTVNAECVSGCSGIYLPTNYKSGGYAQSANFYIPGYQNNGTTFQVRTGMTALLRDAMGVCDRYTYSGGYAACTSWYSGAHDMVIYLQGQQASQAQTVKFIIRSTPSTNNGSYFTYGFSSFQSIIMSFFGFGGDPNTAGIFDPMVLDATLWPINNSQGFELRANGPRLSKAWNKLFQLQVANGKLEDATWNYQLYYNGQLAADGTGGLCQSQYCGLESGYFNNPYYNNAY